MADSIIECMHNEIASRVARGDEKGALAYLQEHFAELPEEVQGEVLTQAYLSALQSETTRIQTIGDIQLRALAALEVLDILKKELEKESA